MKFETFLKLRVGFMSFAFLWCLLGTMAIPLLTIAAFQSAKTSLEMAIVFPPLAVGLVGCSVGAVLLASFIRDDVLTLLKLTAR